MSRNSLVPDGWQIVRLGDIAMERNERAGKDFKADVYSVTKYDGLVRSLDYFNKEVFSRDINGYKILYHDDLAYATIHLDEGSLGIMKGAEKGLVSPMYTVFEVDKSQVYPDFIYRLMKLPMHVARYSRLGEGSIKRRKAVRFDILSALNFTIPPLEYQKLIVTTDSAIKQTELKLAKIQQLRDSLLYDMTENIKVRDKVMYASTPYQELT